MRQIQHLANTQPTLESRIAKVHIHWLLQQESALTFIASSLNI